MVEKLTHRICGWCARQASDYYDRTTNKYFCDSICKDEYLKDRKYYNGY